MLYLVWTAHIVGEPLEDAHVSCAAVLLQRCVQVRICLGPVGRGLACRAGIVTVSRQLPQKPLAEVVTICINGTSGFLPREPQEGIRQELCRQIKQRVGLQM